MSVYHESIQVQSERMPTFHDVTSQAKTALEKSGIQNGILVVYSQHTTCSVMIQEESHDENFWGIKSIMQDLLNVFEKIVPTCRTEGQYLHPGPAHIADATSRKELPSWSLNTDAHLRSIIMGRSESIPIINGKLELGEFGKIYFTDFDQVRARERTVHFQIVGEK
ncbi:MAG: YjbQ family protein [Chloroflexi bacterium]|nr:YjbQ family protein [Chloroflexota bacterium]